MVNQIYTIEAAHAIEDGNELAAAARAKYKDVYPSRVARRMTHLGMLAGICLKQLKIERETPLIYASAFAESQSLEAFIESFPEASPLHFQRSIHPSAAEQTFIANQQPIDRFYPITSEFNLAGQALENAFVADAERVAIVGGEERGTWLRDYNLASHQSFACSLLIKRKGDGIGTVTIEEEPLADACDSTPLDQLAAAIRDRASIRIPSHLFSRWIRIDWI